MNELKKMCMQADDHKRGRGPQTCARIAAQMLGSGMREIWGQIFLGSDADYYVPPSAPRGNKRKNNLVSMESDFLSEPF